MAWQPLSVVTHNPMKSKRYHSHDNAERQLLSDDSLIVEFRNELIEHVKLDLIVVEQDGNGD
jgi:hypothetical protein